MNLLQSSSSLVKRLPIQAARSTVVRNTLYLTTGIYGFYLLVSGPRKLLYRKVATAHPHSASKSLFYFHFFNTSLLQYLFTSGVIYTIGNYHVGAYGSASFLRLFGLSCLAGSILTWWALYNK